MTNSQRLAAVRHRLIEWLSDASADDVAVNSPAGDEPPDRTVEIESESLLIRDGFYCGRRFELESHRAVWFFEEDVVKIFTRQGDLLAVLAGAELTADSGSTHSTMPVLKLRDVAKSGPSLPTSEGSSATTDDRDQADRRRAA